MGRSGYLVKYENDKGSVAYIPISGVGWEKQRVFENLQQQQTNKEKPKPKQNNVFCGSAYSEQYGFV